MINEQQILILRNLQMNEKTGADTPHNKRFGRFLRDGIMVILTLLFIITYAAAFMGKFDPLKDYTILLHLEPVIFIFIGYYFARYPTRRVEETLKTEIQRQTQRAEAAQYAKEKAQQDCEMLEERLKNTKTALKSVLSRETSGENYNSLKAIIKILDS
jgi:amino acid permease